MVVPVTVKLFAFNPLSETSSVALTTSAFEMIELLKVTFLPIALIVPAACNLQFSPNVMF